MLQAQAAQQLALAQQGSGALSPGVQQPQHGGAHTASMAAAADRAHSGALLPLDDAAMRSATGSGAMAQQALSGGGGIGGGRRTSQECGSPAPPFGAASPSHSGTGNTRRGGFQGEHTERSIIPTSQQASWVCHPSHTLHAVFRVVLAQPMIPPCSWVRLVGAA